MRVLSRSALAVGVTALTLASLAGCRPDPAGTVWGVPHGEAPPPRDPKPVGPEPAAAEPAAASVQLDPQIASAAEKLTALAQTDRSGWDRLAYLADVYGHRLSGSDALEGAIDWTLEEMRKDGLDDVRREKVMVPRWVRGEESLELLGPYARKLPVLGLGLTVGTPRRGVTAEVVVVENLAAIKAIDASKIEGKIVVINQPMPPYDSQKHDAGYGPTVQIRAHGPVEAAKKGARAVLIRSVTNYPFRQAHTGSTHYEEGTKKIPAAALPPEDVMMLARMQERGKPVKLKLQLGAKILPDRESANAVGELRGREKPDEVVVIGCHIDSWDVGDGSTDDGGGCVMAMEAARMLKSLDLVPRRTIRVVLYTNEENGLRGGIAYARAHKDEVHAGAIESDSGAAAPWGFGVVGDEAAVAGLQRYAPLFEALGAGAIEPGHGGADISALTKRGVLSLSVRPDASHYFDLHHSHADTVDKVVPEYLQKNAAAMALMAFILAEREELVSIPTALEKGPPARREPDSAPVDEKK